MRSLKEIRFRLRQEAANFYLLWKKPELHEFKPYKRLQLPDPAATVQALRGSGYANSVVALGERILGHNFPLLGCEITTGVDIHWRRDYAHGKDSDVLYFKRIPYLDFEKVGDHKFVWEINRHQHLILLAQAFLLTGRRTFLVEIEAELASWKHQNPFQESINWASALEVAFRALSWIWVYHLVGDELTAQVQELLLNGLFQHGLHLADNLSVYFSPNTHLLGEAVALFVLAILLPELPGSTKWAKMCERIVLEQVEAQVQEDGSHFEQSTYYHVYAVDFFTLFYVVAGRPRGMVPVLEKMANYLSWLLGPSREIHLLGDDDGGRLFHPFGSRKRFGRATLTTCGILLGRKDWIGSFDEISEQAVWWLGADCLSQANPVPAGVSGSRVFAESGSVFVTQGDFYLQMDCGPFGFGGAGHSHSDTLSLTLCYQGNAALIDPGTYTYVSDIQQRNWFRGSGAHNTIRIDGQDQADSINPFRWAGKPSVELLMFKLTAAGWFIDAACQFRGFQHRRRVLLNQVRLLVLDVVTGPDGEHTCDQIWQLGPAASDLFQSTSVPYSTQPSAFSPAYGSKLDGLCRIASWRGRFPISMVMQLGLSKEEVVSVATAELLFQEFS